MSWMGKAIGRSGLAAFGIAAALPLAARAAEGGKEEGMPELPNIFDYLRVIFTNKSVHTDIIGKGFWGLNVLDLVNIIFAFAIISLLIIISIRLKMKLSRVPKGFQALAEVFVRGLKNYFTNILGPDRVEIFLPFVGTLFLYILTMNYVGLIPLLKSPIAMNINVPLSMAICVFCLVQYHGIKQNGPKKYIKHFLGDSAGIPVMDQFLMVLNFFIHVLGEFVKPLSLTLRLFANITAEDTVIAALIGLLAFLPVYVPIPIHLFFLPLALLFGLIQALVFSTLSAVYILLMSAHEEHGHEEHAH
jgi:F-type H+-transporting ATPase subunit a